MRWNPFGRNTHRRSQSFLNRATCVLSAVLALGAYAIEVLPPPKPEPGPGKIPLGPEKPKGPEHNVTLMEEHGVIDLFNKAAKARARAEKEPEAWPECVKCYADILKKYPNTVYLDKWEGPDKDHQLSAYKNGLYKSTRDRVAAEIGTLPPAALTVYRVINESAARTLYLEGHEQLDEHKMELAARDYFQTSWGSDALAWMGELSYERGAWRDAVERLQLAALSPGKSSSPMSILARLLLAQIHLSDKSGAEKTLSALEEALNDPSKGALRIANAEGPVALAKLKARVSSISAVPALADNGNEGSGWSTYFGNAAHVQPAQSRPTRGLRKWSLRIDDLLYGKNAVTADADMVLNDDGTTGQDSSINQQLTVRDGYFYLNDAQVYAAYPAGNPVPGTLTAGGGTAKFQLPAENVKNPPRKIAPAPSVNGEFVALPALLQHPFFATLAGDRVYGVLGIEAPIANAANMRFRRFRQMGEEEKKIGASNYMVCFGRAENTRDTTLLWSLKPGEAAFNNQSKVDQEWLKGAYFTNTPTYESGVLYAMAAVLPPGNDAAVAPVDAWAAAFDAETGRLLWHTQICTATPMRYSGNVRVQPDRGLPVAVANRTVYVVTNLGAVAALDAGGGGIKWIRIYDRSKTVPDQVFGVGEVAQAQEFWAPNPPIVYKNRLIVTPQDSDRIYAYDVESGARVWERSRLGEQETTDLAVGGAPGNAPPAQSRFRHVLGVVNGALALTGTDILFMNALNGKYLTDSIPVDGTIRGRGCVTENSAWISTDKDLLRIDISKNGEKLKFGDPVAFKWADPKIEAGSVYSAGGVLYTVSHSHVNAYIVWEELEAKFLDRLKNDPKDFSTRIELADVYKSIERFEPALAELSKAREAVEQSIKDASSGLIFAQINERKFETLMAMGVQAQNAGKAAEAAAHFKQAYQVGGSPLLADVLQVIALKAEAELYEKSGDLNAAAQIYQQMIAKHGGVVLQDNPNSSKMARLFAQMRQSELKAKNAASYAQIDAQAKAALEEAGSDSKRLENVSALYPNSEYAGKGLLALARMDLEKSPDRARLNAVRYISRHRGGPDTAQALVILALSCERLALLAPAHEALMRLASSDEFKDSQVAFNGLGLDPKSAPGESSVRDWALKRLDEPQHRQAPSQSIFSVGLGSANREPVWRLPAEDGTVPLVPDGIPPVEMRRAVFYLENPNTLSALSGRDGSELWKPRPTAPAGSHGRAFWWDRLLIVCGSESIIAYDSADNGKTAWSQQLKVERGNLGFWAQICGDRLIVAHGGNALQGFDAASGALLWSTQLSASQMSYVPACGDGFAVVASANSNKLTAYNLETGGALWSADISELKTAPAVSADRVYVAQKSLKISVFDGRTGKRVCTDIDMESPAIAMRVSRDLAIVSMENRGLAAFQTDGKHAGFAWNVLLPTGSVVNDFFIDGDDVMISSMLSPLKHDFAAYSIKSQGKIKWKQEMAGDAAAALIQKMQANNARLQVQGRRGQIVFNQNGQFNQLNDDGTENFLHGPDGSGGWQREHVARGELVLMQSNYDNSGAMTKVAALIDRTTGKAVWDAPIKPERPVNGMMVPANIQFFDGGLVLFDGNGRSGYCSAALLRNDDDIKKLAAEAAQNPNDADARIKLAAMMYQNGEHEKALDDLAALLTDARTTEANFAAAYAQFAALRKDLALKQHAALTFYRMEKIPDLAGGTAGWEANPETVLDGWRSIYLASEDPNSRATPKKNAWHGSDDLHASFKGGYDDKNLYIQIAVKDDQHKNDQAEGGHIDFGDSLTLAFDISLLGGIGYRADTFELALGLAKTGKPAGWRRREKGQYLKGHTPIEKDFSVTRKENEKITLYQLALPLEYLGLKPEAGKKFGFAFAVQDQDGGPAIDKSVCSSPGLLGLKEPRFFSQGVLEAKK